MHIHDQQVVLYKGEYNLKPIQKESKPVWDRNINFGSFDLETFIDSDGLAKVYALGFITNVDSIPKLYYLTDYSYLDSNLLILTCIDDMLISRYHNYIFYVHNLGRYDIVFIYSVLLKANVDKGFSYYILNTVMKDNVIIKLDVKIKKYSQTKYPDYKYIKISFVDSLNLLHFS